MSADRDALESFGRDVIRLVYDETFAHMQRVIEGRMRGARRIELARLYKSLDGSSAEVTRRFIAEAVDATFARFLNFFEEVDLPLYFRTIDGEMVNVRQVSDGLAGEPYTDNGWIQKYSKFKDPIDPLGES